MNIIRLLIIHLNLNLNLNLDLNVNLVLNVNLDLNVNQTIDDYLSNFMIFLYQYLAINFTF